jgi:DNA-binding transcriptional ArsR family regulator
VAGGGGEASRLQGAQLRVYVFLLESGRPVGVRELARALGMPPSTVHYALRRLEELGLVRPEGGGYVAARVVRLEGFLYVRGRLVPRLLAYSAFFLGAALGGLALVASRGLTPEGVSLVLVSLLAALATGFEGLNARRRLLRGAPS